PRATARIGCSARTRPSCCRWRVERGTVELRHSVEEPRVADEVIEHLPARFGHRTIVSRREGNAEDAKRRGHGRTVDLDAGSVQAAPRSPYAMSEGQISSASSPTCIFCTPSAQHLITPLSGNSASWPRLYEESNTVPLMRRPGERTD